MSNDQNKNLSWWELQAQVYARARQDKDFRVEMERNPKATLKREFGFDLPASTTLKTVTSEPHALTIVLPSPVSSVEVSDEDLDAVVGASSHVCDPCRGVTIGTNRS